jgi:transmembrane sensor
VSRLEFPLGEHLDKPHDEAALARIWQGIDARYPRRRARRAPAIALVSALAVAGAAAAFLLARRDAGPLRFADGRALTSVEAPAGGALVQLSDGSRVELFSGARFEPLESSGSLFVAVLESGSAGFDVRPGGPRRWRIECGLATVEVVGTHFTCDRSPGRLRVAVQRGAVLVSGERVPDRVRRLAAGETMEVAESPRSAPAAAEPVTTPGAPEAAPGATAPEHAALPAAAPAPAPSPSSSAAWRELARRGRHDEAFAALGSAGIRRESRHLGVQDLFALADVARLSGHPADAEAPLARILADHVADPQASLAAFALGRLELDTLGRPDRAAAVLARALALGIPQSLREDVRARLVEAYARAGDRPAARAAAQDYLREFPSGRYAATIGSQAALH